MSLLGQLGLQGMQGVMGSNPQQLANQAFQNAYNTYGGQMNQSLAQQQLTQYNQMVNARQQTKWKFNGVDCSIREFADMVWTTDCPEKTHFILKYE